MQHCVCVCAIAQSLLCLLLWKTVCQHWHQEELAQNTHPARQVGFTRTFSDHILLYIYLNDYRTKQKQTFGMYTVHTALPTKKCKLLLMCVYSIHLLYSMKVYMATLLYSVCVSFPSLSAVYCYQYFG